MLYALPKKEQSKLPTHFFIACEQFSPSPQNKLKIFFCGEGVAVQGYFKGYQCINSSELLTISRQMTGGLLLMTKTST